MSTNPSLYLRSDSRFYVRSFPFVLPPTILDNIDYEDFRRTERIDVVGQTQLLSKPVVPRQRYSKTFPIGLEFICGLNTTLIDYLKDWATSTLGLEIDKDQVVVIRSCSDVTPHIDFKISAAFAFPLLNSTKGLVYFKDNNGSLRCGVRMRQDKGYLFNVTQVHGMFQDSDCPELWLGRIFFKDISFAQISSLLEAKYGSDCT